MGSEMCIRDRPLVGPYALGYLAAAGLCLQMRGSMSQSSPVSLVLVVIPAGVFVQIVAVAMVSLRGLGPFGPQEVVAWSVADEIVTRFFSILYAAAIAVPLAVLLVRSAPLWRFTPSTPRMGRARRLGMGRSRAGG